MAKPATSDLLTLTAQIVASHTAANTTSPDEVPALIKAVYGALATAGKPVAAMPVQEPAVPVKRSIKPDYLICLEDGARVKVLTRYLRRFGLTPASYRTKWGLPANYPMVAPGIAGGAPVGTQQPELGAAPHVEATVATPVEPALDPQGPEDPMMPDEPEARHTAESVFSNFPGAEEPVEAGSAPEKPGRKRFAQQSMREIRNKPDAGGRPPRMAQRARTGSDPFG